MLIGCIHETDADPEKNEFLNNILGSWKAECERDLISDGYQQPFLKIDDSLFDIYLNYYSDNSCSVFKSEGGHTHASYIIGSIYMTESGLSARKLDLSVVRTTPISNESTYIEEQKHIIYMNENKIFFGDLGGEPFSDTTKRPTSLNFDEFYEKVVE